MPATIFGEPCHNPDWDQSRETVMEFADRMSRGRGWLKMAYALPMPRIGQYPPLRVDEDSALWIMEQTISMVSGTEQKVLIAYVAPAERQLELIDELRQEGLITDGKRDQARETVKNLQNKG